MCRNRQKFFGFWPRSIFVAVWHVALRCSSSIHNMLRKIIFSFSYFSIVYSRVSQFVFFSLPFQPSALPLQIGSQTPTSERQERRRERFLSKEGKNLSRSFTFMKSGISTYDELTNNVVSPLPCFFASLDAADEWMEDVEGVCLNFQSLHWALRA